MNGIRRVAVRMRPKASDAASTDRPTPVADAQDTPSPRRAAISAPRPAAERNIWDLPDAQDDVPQDNLDYAAPKTAQNPETPLILTQSEHGTPQAPRPTRAKTRILGFHAEDVTDSPLENGRQPPKGPAFPAGFLVVIDGPGQGAFFPVTTHVSSIGRGADQDITLDFGDESISRSAHASVMYDTEQKRFFLGHGNKANAVRRNGTPVLTTEDLTHGDRIRIGKTTLRFHAFCDDSFDWDEPDQDGAEHG